MVKIMVKIPPNFFPLLPDSSCPFLGEIP